MNIKNFKRKKQIVFIIFFIIISIVFILKSAFLNANVENQAEKIKNLALEYLNGNYSDTFTALGYQSSSWAYDYSTVNFLSEKYSDTVEVRVYEENGIYTFKDDYFKLTMKKDAEKYFKAFTSKYCYAIETKVRFISFGVDANLNFIDYVATENCNIEIYFISKDTFSTQHINSILDEIANNKIKGFFRFVVTSDENLLSDYTISEIVNEQSDKVISQESYSI